MNGIVNQVMKTNQLNAEGHVLRVLRRFAVAALAGELVTSFGLTGWKKGEALNGIVKIAGTWIEKRETIRTQDIDAALERTRIYLSAHRDRFVSPEVTTGVDGWFDDAGFCIQPEVWARIHDGEDSQATARLHQAANVLKSNDGPTLQLTLDVRRSVR